MGGAQELRVEYLPTASLVCYENNAKIHTDEQVEQIANSIREFGNCDPIGIWHNAEGKPEIVEGHGRLLALKSLGYETAPTISLDHLTDEQRRAYAHVHNQTTLTSGFDEDILAAEFQALDFDWESFGFELPDVESMDDYDFDERDEPDVVDGRVSTGDVWQLGQHRLICGDSTEPEIWERLMCGARADLMVTDPPYNVDITGGTKDALKIQNDNMSDGEFKSMLIGFMECAVSVMSEGAPFYIWHASRTQTDFEEAINKSGLEVRQQIIWNKSVFVLGRQDYQWKHEPCFYGWKEGAAHYFVDDRTQTTVWSEKRKDIGSMKKDELLKFTEELLRSIDDEETTVWDFNKPSKSAYHPTMKPIELMGKCVINSSKKGDVVIDPFLGSGTTLLACERTGRACMGIELDPHYCDVIIARWEDETGQKAVLVPS